MSERTWPENAWPTAEQWLPWFLAQTTETQLEIAERQLASAQRAGECFMRNHDGLYEELRQAQLLAMSEYQRGRQDAADELAAAWAEHMEEST